MENNPDRIQIRLLCIFNHTPCYIVTQAWIISALFICLFFFLIRITAFQRWLVHSDFFFFKATANLTENKKQTTFVEHLWALNHL